MYDNCLWFYACNRNFNMVHELIKTTAEHYQTSLVACRYSPDYKMITRGSEYSFEDQEDIYYVFPLRTLSNSENTSDSMSLQQDLPPRPRSKSSDYRDTVHIPEQVQVTDGQVRTFSTITNYDMINGQCKHSANKRLQ